MLAKAGGFQRDTLQIGEDGVRGVGAVIEPVAVATGHKQVRPAQLGDFLLYGAQGETSVTRQLAEMVFARRIGKEEPQNLGPHFRKNDLDGRHNE